ncbi:hypothetical protein J6590_068836 [Homalodisca vitripennis]|nr:hypothetical protein J6590_068836 [Homalodisca vitripennis]
MAAVKLLCAPRLEHSMVRGPVLEQRYVGYVTCAAIYRIQYSYSRQDNNVDPELILSESNQIRAKHCLFYCETDYSEDSTFLTSTARGKIFYARCEMRRQMRGTLINPLATENYQKRKTEPNQHLRASEE